MVPSVHLALIFLLIRSSLNATFYGTVFVCGPAVADNVNFGVPATEGEGSKSPPSLIPSKPLMMQPQKLHRIMHSSFPTSRHNLIDTMT